MEENPYRAPLLGEVDARYAAWPRRVISLGAGFCLALAAVFGMIAAAAGLGLPLPVATTPFVVIASTVSFIAWVVTAWSILNRHWKTALFASSLAVGFVAASVWTWQAIFG